MKYNEVLCKAESVKDLFGMTTILLEDEAPASLADTVETGCMMRNGMAIAVRLTGTTPDGIRVSWVEELETHGPDSKAHIRDLDAEKCFRLLRQMKPGPAMQFRTFLATAANMMQERANQMMQDYTAQAVFAAKIRDLSVWTGRGQEYAVPHVPQPEGQVII